MRRGRSVKIVTAGRQRDAPFVAQLVVAMRPLSTARQRDRLTSWPIATKSTLENGNGGPKLRPEKNRLRLSANGRTRAAAVTTSGTKRLSVSAKKLTGQANMDEPPSTLAGQSTSLFGMAGSNDRRRAHGATLPPCRINADGRASSSTTRTAMTNPTGSWGSGCAAAAMRRSIDQPAHSSRVAAGKGGSLRHASPPRHQTVHHPDTAVKTRLYGPSYGVMVARAKVKAGSALPKEAIRQCSSRFLDLSASTARRKRRWLRRRARSSSA